ncbi:Transcription elongation factor GreA [bioreactor metagenome]|uniref:Transcription elongation factor GreA n=1 Tax=bioreactor metagenome TaxID=1076179 RepID=A0A644T5F7_9ZZZZ|nr:transcription elongation factor GreA [Candidatus Elulimicrobiales bacterium]
MAKEVKEYLTIEKKKELELELNNLKTVRRKEIADAIEWSKSLGDLAENAEYSQAREDQARCEARIGELETILQNAIITNSNESRNGVSVGSVVVVNNMESEEINTFTIVGSEEVDLDSGKISNESPLGSALLGKNEGDTVTFMAPKGQVNYKIKKIN